jgi:hypothetical protein
MTPISLPSLAERRRGTWHQTVRGGTRGSGDGNFDPQSPDGSDAGDRTVAVINVFRAFTTAAVALANGASKIVMVRTVEKALALRDAGIGQICMARAAAGHQIASNSATRLSRSRRSIFGTNRSFSGPALVHRASSRRQTRPYGPTRPRWSRQRRPSALFSRGRPIRSPWSRWATTG